MRTEYVDENLCGQGAYELAAADGDAEVTIFATGSEVEIALDAREQLQAQGHPTRVVSVPCFELFEEQDDAYKKAIIGDAPVKIAVEAGIRLGWDRFIGTDGIFVGMTGFGASAPDRSSSTRISASPPRRPSRRPWKRLHGGGKRRSRPGRRRSCETGQATRSKRSGAPAGLFRPAPL